MSVTIQDNFDTAAAKPTDARYGPYANLAAAKAAIPQVFRYEGLTVGIGTPVQEYWWVNGVTDGDLVQKTATGNVTSVSAGPGILVNNTNPQIPDVSVDTSYVQVVSNLSTSVSTDGTSDVKYPSVKAVKTYADGLVVGLLNDRGNWAASASSPGPYPTNPPATGSGTLGAILKGDIWFINVAGYLGTTYVSVGASVRALVDSPSPSTSTDWDIIDAGLGFTPENIANKVSTGANVNADPTSTVKYPSVKALVEYVQTYSPAPTVPTLQQVTSAGNITTNDVKVNSLYLYDQTVSGQYGQVICDDNTLYFYNTNGFPNIASAEGVLRIYKPSSFSTSANLDASGITANQIYSFPNASGIIALVSDITTALANYVPYIGATATIQLGIHGVSGNSSGNIFVIDGNSLTFYDLGNSTIVNKVSVKCTHTGSGNFAILDSSTSTPYVGVSGGSGSSIVYLDTTTGYGALSLGGTSGGASLYCNNITSNRLLELPDSSGTLLTTIATSAGNLTTGTDGKVTIPDANTTTVGLVNTGTQTFNGDKTIKGSVSTSASAALNVTNSSNTSLLYARNDGNVGIGTTSPSSKLYVDGDITISSPNYLNLSYVKLGGSVTTSTLNYATFLATETNKGVAIVAKANGTPTTYGYAFQFIADGADIHQLLFVGNNSAQKHIISTSVTPGNTAWPLVLRCPVDLWDNSPNDLLTLTKDQVVKINDGGATSGSESAVLQLNSTSKGFLPPRMTGAQASAISSKVEGLMVYVTDTTGGFASKGWWGWDGSAWQKLG